MANDVSSDSSSFVHDVKRLLFDSTTALDDIRRLYSQTPLSVRQTSVHDISKLVRERTRSDGRVSEADNFIVHLLGADAPEELFLEFMAAVESADCHDEFFRMVQLSNVCRTMMKDTRRASSSAWICEAFMRRAKALKPGSINETDDDCLLKDPDPRREVEKFYKALLDEIRDLTSEAKNQGEIYKNIVVGCVLSLYGEPLALMPLDLEHYSAIATNLFSFVVEFKMDPLYFLDHAFKNVSKISLAVFYLHVFTGADNLSHSSQVYSVNFLLDSIFALSSAALHSEDPRVQHKGLLLMYHVLKRFAHPERLSWTNNFDYLKSLAHLMVFSQIKAVRKLAVQVFDLIASNFNEDSAYCLALNASHLNGDPGFCGYVVTRIKGFVIVENNSKFKGKPLVDLLTTYCVLPTNFHSSTDVILSTLNLIRFLLVYRGDVGVSQWLCQDLDDCFLKPLRETLHVTLKETREHLSELCESEKKAVVREEERQPEVSLVVGGQNLPSLSSVEKITMVESSLTKFQLIGSILSRIEELLVEYKERCN